MNNMPNPLMQNTAAPRYSQQIPDNYTYPPSYQQYMPDSPVYPVPGIDGVVNSYMNNNADNADIQAMLERYIGKIMKAEFLVGDVLEDKLGRLLSVGTNYIVLAMLDSKIIMVCSTDTLKFATVLLDEETNDAAF
jgi:hypothetical protein